MTDKAHILVVDDEISNRLILSGYFENEGYRVSQAEDGTAMWDIIAKGDVDLIMLDIRLPGEDGLTLLRNIRKESEVGVIMVTSKSDDVDRIVALEMGADDYVIKPFNPRELLARSKNLLKRLSAVVVPVNSQNILQFGVWSLDLNQRSLRHENHGDMRLTRGEFELLRAFASNTGRVLTRDNLLDHLNHNDWDPSDRTVDVLVGRIRKKIEVDPKDPHFIITVHGVGYLFTGGQKAMHHET